MAAWGVLAVLCSTFIWGLMGPIMRQEASYGLTSFDISLVRATGAALLLGLIGYFRGRSLRCPRALMFHRAVNGLFGVVGLYVLSNYALITIPVGLATVLFYTAPLWVVTLAHALGKERLTPLRILAVVIALGGVWWSAGEVHFLGYGLRGPVAMLVAGFSYAVFLLNGRYGPGAEDPFGNYFHTYVAGTGMLWIMACFTPAVERLLALPWEGWALLGYLVLVPTLGAYGLVMWALQHVPSAVVSLLSMTEMLFALFWGWMLLGEAPTTATLGGAACIGTAVLVVTWEGYRAAGKELPVRDPQGGIDD